MYIVFVAQEFDQEVGSHRSELDCAGDSEGDLFGCDLPTIQSCEQVLSERAASPVEPSPDSPVLPVWMERPGAPKAVTVGGDLRSRYGALQASITTRCDEVRI